MLFLKLIILDKMFGGYPLRMLEQAVLQGSLSVAWWSLCKLGVLGMYVVRMPATTVSSLTPQKTVQQTKNKPLAICWTTIDGCSQHVEDDWIIVEEID